MSKGAIHLQILEPSQSNGKGFFSDASQADRPKRGRKWGQASIKATRSAVPVRSIVTIVQVANGWGMTSKFEKGSRMVGFRIGLRCKQTERNV